MRTGPTPTPPSTPPPTPNSTDSIHSIVSPKNQNFVAISSGEWGYDHNENFITSSSGEGGYDHNEYGFGAVGYGQKLRYPSELVGLLRYENFFSSNDSMDVSI